MDAPLAAELLKHIEGFKRLHAGFPGDDMMSRGEFFLLKALHELALSAGRDGGCEDVHVSRLSDHMRISMPAASQMLGALEKKRLIVRNVDVSDRRKITVGLTPKGAELMHRAKRNFDAGMLEIVARLGEDDTRTFIRLCARVRAILEELHAKQFAECNERKDKI